MTSKEKKHGFRRNATVKRRNICVVTTSRADYGLLFWLLKEIQGDPHLQLQLIATGMHLSPEFGSTYKRIELDGFRLDRKCEMLLSSDSESAIVKSVGLGLVSFADALATLRPDIVVVLGDRFELLSIAITALISRIPLAHIHGGETSQGAFDEATRHAISKMASVHFPATEVYRRRIIQMGESPERVFNFGAPGLDSIYRTRLLTKRQLERSLGFRLKAPISMVTYHPVTLDSGDRRTELENILDAITSSKLLAIFTQANADPRGRMINERLRLFCARAPERFHLCQNMGQIGYLSALKYVNLMIGNSSSGLTEAPSFKVPVVNIGDRQKGRMKGANVIDSGTSFAQVKEAIATALSKDFTESLRNSPNPYDKHQDGRTSYRIKEVLKGIELGDHLLKKEFRDLDFSCQS